MAGDGSTHFTATPAHLKERCASGSREQAPPIFSLGRSADDRAAHPLSTHAGRAGCIRTPLTKDMLQLHYFPSNASMAPHILLEEIGLPFELKRVARDEGEHKSPAYLKLNPNGLIPVLVDGELVLYEAAAICLHLVDSHPGTGLAPSLGTSERAHFYKWLVWMTNTLQVHLIHYFYPDRLIDPGNTDGAAQVKRQAQARVDTLVDHLENHLAQGGPWMLGARYSALDAYAFMLCRWTRGFQRPARTLPHLGEYLHRMLQRPAVRRALATEQLQAPFV
jgi:glutathione S-transferase